MSDWHGGLFGAHHWARQFQQFGHEVRIIAAKKKEDRLSRWVTELAERRGYWKAVVAVATKNARMAWAMRSKGEAFKPMT